MPTSIEKLIHNFDDVLPERKCKHEGSPIPSYLRGTLLRNGPGIYSWGDTKYNHWFDGDAYVQRYEFKDGEMFYSARALESDSYLLNKQANRIVVGSFGTKAFPDPCKNIFQKFFSFFQPHTPTDNALVAFQELGDTVYALTEIPVLVPVAPDTLDVGPSIYADKTLFSVHSATAHCHSDEEGNVYNIGSRYGKDSEYVIVKMAPKKETVPPGEATFDASIVATVHSDSKGPSYYHSFGMTRNHFILLESPLKLNVFTLATMKYSGSSFGNAMSWKDGLLTNVVIVDRTTGKQIERKVTCDAFFTFHHANAFERDGCLVVDYARYRRVSDFNHFLLENMKKPDFAEKNSGDYAPYAARMIVPLNVPEGAKNEDNLLKHLSWVGKCKAILKENGSIHVDDEQLSEHVMEFPRYNYSHNAKQYRYMYGTSVLGRNQEKVGVVKVDCDEKKSFVWRLDHEDQLAGEPVFVANPEGKEEDDGVVIVPVMTVKDGDNPLVAVLSAKNMEEIARFSIPVDRIPFGFHGTFTTKHSKVAPKPKKEQK